MTPFQGVDEGSTPFARSSEAKPSAECKMSFSSLNAPNKKRLLLRTVFYFSAKEIFNFASKASPIFCKKERLGL